jgi:hypothetical protein
MIGKIPRFVWVIIGVALVFLTLYVLKVSIRIDGGTFSISCGLFQ